MHVLHHILAALIFCCTFSTVALADKPTILVVPKEKNAFWNIVNEGVLKAADERGVEVIFRGPTSAENLAGQLEILQKGTDAKVNAIVLAPSHTSQAVPILQRARKQGIHVVIIDSDMNFKDRVTFVASDNYAAGAMIARYLIHLEQDGNTVLSIGYRETNSSTTQRQKGFSDTIAKAKNCRLNIKRVYTDGSIGSTFYNATAALEQEGKVSAIFAPSENTTIGTLRALREKKTVGNPKFVCFDLSEEIRHGLIKGEIQGTVVQDPYQIGYLGIMAACDAMENKAVPKRIVTRTTLITSPEELKAFDRQRVQSFLD